MGEIHFGQKLSEKSGLAILEDRKNRLVKHIHRLTSVEADLKPFLAILGTAMRAKGWALTTFLREAWGSTKEELFEKADGV
jgi:hypothetical protein